MTRDTVINPLKILPLHFEIRFRTLQKDLNRLLTPNSLSFKKKMFRYKYKIIMRRCTCDIVDWNYKTSQSRKAYLTKLVYLHIYTYIFCIFFCFFFVFFFVLTVFNFWRERLKVLLCFWWVLHMLRNIKKIRDPYFLLAYLEVWSLKQFLEKKE